MLRAVGLRNAPAGAVRAVVSEPAPQKRRFFLLLYFQPMGSPSVFGEKACSGGSPRLPPHGLDKGRKRAFVGTAAPPPLTRRKGSQGQQGAVFSTLRETAVLFVNGVVILPLEERAFLLSIFRPSGRPKWVRAPARKKRLVANGKPHALLALPCLLGWLLCFRQEYHQGIQMAFHSAPNSNGFFTRLS